MDRAWIFNIEHDGPPDIIIYCKFSLIPTRYEEEKVNVDNCI